MNHHEISTVPRFRPIGFTLAVAVGFLAWVAPLNARATELAGAELVVERSPTAHDCPDAAALASAALKLGSPPTAPGPPLGLAVTFDRGLDGYFARIEATGRKQGERELRTKSDTCDSLAQATAVVLAVLSDLLPPPSPEPAPAPAPTKPATIAAPAPPPTSALSVAFGLDSALTYGLLGNAFTGLAAAAFRARYRSAELELGGFASTPHFERLAPGFVSVTLLSGTALGCYWLGGDEHATVGGCGGLGLGSLSGHGHGFVSDDSAAKLWAAALGGLAARLPLQARWAVRLSLSAIVPFRAQTFVVESLGRAFRSTPAAISLRFGPEFRFW